MSTGGYSEYAILHVYVHNVYYILSLCDACINIYYNYMHINKYIYIYCIYIYMQYINNKYVYIYICMCYCV